MTQLDLQQKLERAEAYAESLNQLLTSRDDELLKTERERDTLQQQVNALVAIVNRIIDTGELSRPEHESLEVELCALVDSAGKAVSDERKNFESLIMLISRGLADVEKGTNGYHDPQIQVFWENYQYSKGLNDYLSAQLRQPEGEGK